MKLQHALQKHLHQASAVTRSAFRAVLNRTESQHPTQLSQISGLSDETLDDIELVQHFGFTSNPPANTQGIVIPLGGKSSHGVVIATENGDYRVQALPSGCAAVYDQSGTQIVLNNDGTIDVFADKTTVHGDVAIDGALTVSQTVISDGDQVAGGVSQITHSHGGVEAGPSSTGAPN